MRAYFSKLLKTQFLLCKYFAAISVASSVLLLCVYKILFKNFESFLIGVIYDFSMTLHCCNSEKF